MPWNQIEIGQHININIGYNFKQKRIIMDDEKLLWVD